MANELQLLAVAPKACIRVPLVARDTLHLELHLDRVVVVLAVRAAPPTGLFLVALHGLADGNPESLVRGRLVAGVLGTEHPVVDGDLGVLFVLGCGQELFLIGNATKPRNHHLRHLCVVHVLLLSGDLAAICADCQRCGCACNGGDEAARLQGLPNQSGESVGLVWCDGTGVHNQVARACAATTYHQIDADGHIACAGVGGREFVDDGLAVHRRVLSGLAVLGLLGRDQHLDGYGHVMLLMWLRHRWP